VPARLILAQSSHTSIHLFQGLGNFERLTDGFNSHELSSQPFASFSTAHVKTKNTSTPRLSSFDRLTGGYNRHGPSSQPHAIFQQLNSNSRSRQSVQNSNKSIYSPSFAHLRREDFQHLSLALVLQRVDCLHLLGLGFLGCGFDVGVVDSLRQNSYFSYVFSIQFDEEGRDADGLLLFGGLLASVLGEPLTPGQTDLSVVY
jgi:hypothetical protein